MDSTNNAIRVGIAGLGRSGWNIHARTLQTMPEKYRITTVMDPVPERRQEAMAAFGCRAVDDLDTLVADEEVELIVVATPSYLHAPHTIQALQAGRNVVSEKPMATCLADADAMIAAAKSADRILAIFQNRRYEPMFRKIQEIIASGKLGRIVMIRIATHRFARRWDWQTLKKFGGGLLNNIGAHLVDQALQLFGEKEPRIFAKLDRTLTLGDAEDHPKVILAAAGAPTIEVEITASCAYPQERWLVMGTRGGLVGSGAGIRWKYFDEAELPVRKL
ncbi:MAG: Gfo/Idh/MocA family protein, partial [Alphaproteobacteria bacterium]